MPEEVDCFLSYAREDKRLAERIFIWLRRHGIRVWMDKPPQPYASEGLVAGVDWHDVIQMQIQKAGLFLPIFTEAGVRPGSYFEYELKTALENLSDTSDRPRTIIPVINGGDVPELSVAGRSFSEFQWIDVEVDGLNALLRSFPRDQPGGSRSESGGGVLTLQVSSVDELVDAIGPDRIIKLAPGDYNLTGIKERSHRFMSIEPEFDGPQIIFQNLRNTEFVCEGPELAHLYVEPRYTFPLYLFDCEAVRIGRLRFGHSPEPGSCVGGVVKIVRSKTIDLSDCDLYGCGTVGVELEDCENVVISNTVIRDCNTGVASIGDCRDVVLHHCTFSNNDVSFGFSVSNSDNVRIVASTIQDNTASQYLSPETPLVASNRSTNVALEGCDIVLHPFVQVVDPSQGVEVLQCEIH